MPNARRQRLRGADRQRALYAHKTLNNQTGHERPTVPPAIRCTPSLDAALRLPKFGHPQFSMQR